MPRQDGTGPRGEGPFTGRGEGYCVLRIPDQEGRPIVGLAGRQGWPIQIYRPPTGAQGRRVMCCPQQPPVWWEHERHPQRKRRGRRCR